MGYGGDLLHAWHFHGKWKDHLVLKNKEGISKFSLYNFGWNLVRVLALPQKLHGFYVNDSVEDENITCNCTQSP